MKIRQIDIRYFRGIKKLIWNVPDQHIYCLIGKGDSAKSTILEAIGYAFHPHWNCSFSDSDFHLCITDNPIAIEVLIGDLPKEFLSELKYGTHLRGWNISTFELHDEPLDDDELVLSVRLTVKRDLEPKWKIVTDRDPEGVDFKTTDRAKTNVGLIGSYSEKQLTWAAGSALTKITESKKLNESLVDATRAARISLDGQRDALEHFDAAAEKSELVAKSLGVPVEQTYKAQLDVAAISIRVGGLTLHDGEMPIRQLGMGSRRMLLCGIQKQSLEERHITLFDELELGLEPYRIARLVKHINDDITGQYFLTTHSPSVLRELSVEQLHVVHKNEHEVRVVSTTNKDLETLNIQGQLRSSAEAFLSKKIVVCEGATEVGFLRGLDNYWIDSGNNPFSYSGTALLDAHGAKNIRNLAIGFKALHYDVCAVADGDSPRNFSLDDANLIQSKNIVLLMWSEQLALEQRAMLDLPWPCIVSSVELARRNSFPVHENVRSKLNVALDPDVNKWVESKILRKAIGDAAKSSDWFKSISGGECWVKEISSAFKDAEFNATNLGSNIQRLRAWLDSD